MCSNTHRWGSSLEVTPLIVGELQWMGEQRRSKEGHNTMWKWQILLLLHSTAGPVNHTPGNTKYLENPAHCFRETVGRGVQRHRWSLGSHCASAQPPQVPRLLLSPEQHPANRLELLEAQRLEVLFQAQGSSVSAAGPQGFLSGAL